MSMSSHLYSMIMETLGKLVKDRTDANGDYLHMQISFSDTFRMYICLCPMLQDMLVIHSEYDLSPSLSDTIVLPKKRFGGFITTYTNPEYIGLREDPETEDIRDIYKKYPSDTDLIFDVNSNKNH